MQIPSTLTVSLALLCAACAPEVRDQPVAADDIWTEAPGGEPPPVAIDFVDRATGAEYGLPRAGQKSIADLLALFPQAPLGVNDPDLFVADGVEVATDQCRGGDVTVIDGLPITIEGVVTLYPRQYMKLPICGQDERHYGVYTIEDDTGGLIVLRDSRIATFTMGDRIRLTVSGIMLTYGRDLDTRAVIISDVEDLGTSSPVMFEKLDKPITSEQVGRVHRIEGFVAQSPTKNNFNEVVLTPRLYDADVKLSDLRDEALTCALACEPSCNCAKPEICGAACASLCLEAGATSLPAEDLPVCWLASVGSELGKRGLTYPLGAHLRITGPVVNNFERQIWVLDPAQVETLAN